MTQGVKIKEISLKISSGNFMLLLSILHCNSFACIENGPLLISGPSVVP